MSFEADVVTAHRMPDEMLAYGARPHGRGIEVIIAGAGGAAHLPGMLAAVTPLPVIGVPVPLKNLDGMDSLLSIVQMPAGVPVATVAIGGARNAGLLAVRILASGDAALQQRMVDFQADLRKAATDKGAVGPRRRRRRPEARLLSDSPAPGRLVAIDVARCLALLGMVATHVLETRGPDGSLAFGHALAGGRASALFAVLAGVSIALVTGRDRPLVGGARARAAAGLGVRALLVAALGLVLGQVDSGIAVILTYYGVLFLLALPFLGLSARALALLAAGWIVLAPVLSHLVRPSLPERQFASPTWEQLLDDPGGLVAELTFTGYYPAVPWLAYVLAGMAVGRLDLTSRRTAAVLAVGGAVAAVAATVVSRAWTARPSVREALLTDPPAPDADAAALLDRIAEGMPGTTPTDGAWEWLGVVAPHTATPLDLLQTTGSALLVDRRGAAGPLRRRTRGTPGRGGVLRRRRDDPDPLLGARAGPLARPPARRPPGQLPLPRPAPARDRGGVRRDLLPRPARGTGARGVAGRGRGARP